MNEDLWKEFADQDLSWFEVNNRDQALFLIGERDLEVQLIAIRGALVRNRQADAAVAAKIKELEKQISAYAGCDQDYQMYLEGTWVDAVYDNVFQDAAHSMAAVGMLAPFVESLFVAIFSGLRKYGQGADKAQSDDPRIVASQNEFWDPHFVFDQRGRRRDLVAGIRQLSRTTGLSDHLPTGYGTMLSALFAYRHRVFHLGFEWPIQERTKFDERLQSGDWPTGWFRKSTTSGDPWIFYMSDQFIQHCLTTIDEVLEGVGAYLKQQQPDGEGLDGDLDGRNRN